MISIIIPTYNESKRLPATLAAIGKSKRGSEVIVIDAGSVDGTPQIARDHGARVLVSPRRQRACQMNLGVRHAQGEVLLFLHADILLNASALNQIDAALTEERVVGGGFARRYDSDSWFLRVTCRLADWRARWTGWFLGDQGIFVRRMTFERLGGFRDLELFEDLEFSRRMAQAGQVVTLRPPLTASARRFRRRGAVRTTLSDFWLTCRYLTGANPNELAVERRVSARETGADGGPG